MGERLQDILDEISSMVDEAVGTNLKGEDMEENSTPTLSEWLKTNNDGPNGTRLTRFRRTKAQLDRGLNRGEAFAEYLAKRTSSNTATN